MGVGFSEKGENNAPYNFNKKRVDSTTTTMRGAMSEDQEKYNVEEGSMIALVVSIRDLAESMFIRYPHLRKEYERKLKEESGEVRKVIPFPKKGGKE